MASYSKFYLTLLSGKLIFADNYRGKIISNFVWLKLKFKLYKKVHFVKEPLLRSRTFIEFQSNYYRI